ncbi:unnamed protein product [Fusarium graminearum]|nr:unnamed protein product [Fusarium graminearum]CZS85764.1 unnamed protein product [Fusarium graminearum]
MSALSLATGAVAETIPDPGWECPHFLPPPPPPEAPPLPVLVQKPVETCSWEENMFVCPPTLLIDLEEDAEFKLGVVEEEACESRFGPIVAHLPYSEKDWSLTYEMVTVDGCCLVPAAGCAGLPTMPEGRKISKVLQHLKIKVHLEHEEAKRRESVGAPLSSGPAEPKFVMHRTMDIKFLDPPGLVPSPEDHDEDMDLPVLNDGTLPPPQNLPLGLYINEWLSSHQIKIKMIHLRYIWADQQLLTISTARDGRPLGLVRPETMVNARLERRRKSGGGAFSSRTLLSDRHLGPTTC